MIWIEHNNILKKVYTTQSKLIVGGKLAKQKTELNDDLFLK